MREDENTIEVNQDEQLSVTEEPNLAELQQLWRESADIQRRAGIPPAPNHPPNEPPTRARKKPSKKRVKDDGMDPAERKQAIGERLFKFLCELRPTAFYTHRIGNVVGTLLEVNENHLIPNI